MRTIYRVLAGVIGAMLGLAGCSENGVEEYGCPAAEYGVPSARYNITGRVLNSLTSEGVAGLEVSLHGGPADTTAADGTFGIDAAYFPCDDNCDLLLRDIDGADNGTFAPHTEPLDLQQTAPGDGRWYEGRFEQHDLFVTLDPVRAKATEDRP